MSVGARIKEARKQHLGLTQRQLAERLDIEPVNVSRWEREVAEPRIRHIKQIADLADLPVSWFFASNGPEEEAA